MPPTLSPLLALPREIRDEIYSHLFSLPLLDNSGQKLNNPLLLDISAHIPKSPLGFPTTSLSGPSIPFSLLAPLCKSCKQLHYETIPFYLSSCLLLIEDSITTKYLLSWLDTFGDAGFKAVRHVEFADFSQYEEDIDHQLLSRCPNLVTLGLVMRKTRSVQPEKVPGPRSSTRAPRGLVESRRLGEQKLPFVIEAFHLDAVLKLSKLERLAFSFPDEKSVHTQQVLSVNLKKWFQQQWEDRNQWVEMDSGFDDWCIYE